MSQNRKTRAALLALACATVAILPLPVTPVQQPAPVAAFSAQTTYFPWVRNSGSPFRLFVPLYSPDTAAAMPAAAAALAASGLPGRRMNSLVTRNGEGLQLQGEPYSFVGTNVSYLAGPFFPESGSEGIIAHLSASGVQVIRVWVLPWNNLDRVERMLDLGRKYDIRFILTLQDFFGNLDGSCFGRYETSDLPHIRNVVTRFAGRPEVLAWELMNEPTCPASDSGPSCWEALCRWAEVTSREIKHLDPNHLVAVGSQNAGFDEQAREVFRRIHALDSIDLVSIHRSAGSLMETEMAIAHELGKPVYVGEVYVRGHDESCQPLPDNALGRRAEIIAADLEATRESGVDGYLLWQFAYGGVDMGSHIEYFCSVYDYFADDPVWSVIRAARR